MEITSRSLNGSEAKIPAGVPTSLRAPASLDTPRHTAPRRFVQVLKARNESLLANGHSAGETTAPRASIAGTPSSARPAPLADGPSDLSSAPAKAVAPSVALPNGNANTTNPSTTSLHRSSAVVAPVPGVTSSSGSQAPATARTADSRSHKPNSHTPKDTRVKAKIPAAQAPDRLTQTSSASTLTSVATSSDSSLSIPPAQSSITSGLPPPKANGVRFRSPLESSRASHEKPRSHSNKIAKPRPLVASSSSSTLSSPGSGQPPSPPLPEILPETAKPIEQWEKDDQYIIDYMNWTFKQDPQASTTEIMLEIARRVSYNLARLQCPY
ncbi:hypothetical protein FRC08_010937 [Ceratobasidium sp. 394]|nr:hypothetical protein FRC08_010937 [Ceratobasidium sp. 394]